MNCVPDIVRYGTNTLKHNMIPSEIKHKSKKIGTAKGITGILSVHVRSFFCWKNVIPLRITPQKSIILYKMMIKRSGYGFYFFEKAV